VPADHQRVDRQPLLVISDGLSMEQQCDAEGEFHRWNAGRSFVGQLGDLASRITSPSLFSTSCIESEF
jgi:hypothetical protein